MKLIGPVIAAALLVAPGAFAQSLPVEVFGRLPAVDDVAISPDGRRVAVAGSNASGQSGIIIRRLDEADDSRPWGVGEDMQLRSVSWADNERVSYLLTQTFRPGQVLPPGMYFQGSPRRVVYFRWGAINITEGEVRALTTNPENEWADQGASLIAPIEGDPGYGRMIGRSQSLYRSNSVLYRVHLDSGRVRPLIVAGVNEDTVDFILDRTGAVVGRLDADEATNRWRLFTYDGETPRLLLEDVSRFGDTISVVGLMPDGRFAALEPNEAGYTTLYAIDRASGELQAVHEVENADIEAALVDPWTREVIGVTWIAVETEQHFFDPTLQRAREALIAALPEGAASRLVTWSQDRTRFIAYVEQGLDGGAYYLFNLPDRSLRLLAPRYPELMRAHLGERQSITYRARDGTRVPAYLTLPAGVEARNLPLVLLVHGGPHARDTMDFDWWASFLVSRGYAVLQPNFRGSSGYGAAWEEAGRRQWGALMQTDVEDGANALARAGIADPARTCIVGAKYGGYAALAGATLTPDRYRCAVSVAGVSDLPLMLLQRERQTGDDSVTSDWWRASIGDREEDRERIRAVSPVFLADRVRIPVLLLHGTDDSVVPID